MPLSKHEKKLVRKMILDDPREEVMEEIADMDDVVVRNKIKLWKEAKLRILRNDIQTLETAKKLVELLEQ